MRLNLGGFGAACALSVALAAPVAEAQKPGGVLIMSHFDSPASMSMHEEATGAVNRPMMGVFNNLVMFDQHVAQNSMASIVPRPGHCLVVERGGDRANRRCARVSNGTTANPLSPRTSNALGTC